MDGMPEYVVDPSMRFSDIIVPTIDTVRAHFLLELLISNVKQVRCIIKIQLCVCIGGWITYNCNYI